MSNGIDYDRLMMDALDNRLSESERPQLDEYFRRYPEEMVVFDRMRGVDNALRCDPLDKAPVQFHAEVMAAIAQAPSTLLTLKPTQIIFIAGVAGLFLTVAGGTLLAIILSLTPAFQLAVEGGFIAIARAGLDIAVSMLSALLTVTRVVFSQPFPWIVMLGMVAIVALWLRVMVAVYIPRSTLSAN